MTIPAVGMTSPSFCARFNERVYITDRTGDFGRDACGWIYNHNGPMDVATLAREDLIGNASKGGYRGSAVRLAPQSQSSVELFRLRRKSTTSLIFYDSSVNVSSASTPLALCSAMTRRPFVLGRTA